MSLSDRQDAAVGVAFRGLEGYYFDNGDGEGDGMFVNSIHAPEGDGVGEGLHLQRGVADSSGVYITHSWRLWVRGYAMSGNEFDHLIQWSVRDEFV